MPNPTTPNPLLVVKHEYALHWSPVGDFFAWSRLVDNDPKKSYSVQFPTREAAEKAIPEFDEMPWFQSPPTRHSLDIFP